MTSGRSLDEQHRRTSPRKAAAARLLPAAGHSDALNRLTDLASRLLSVTGVEMSTQISLLTDVQTIAAGTGLDASAVGSQSPLEDSLCTVTADSGGPLVVSEASLDDRVALLPPVVSGAVGAYLGIPLTAADGSIVGALCAFGPAAREWSAYDVALMEELAGAVMAQLELQALSAEYEASRVRWDLAIDAAGIGTFEWDFASGRLECDERMQALFGFVPGEFRGHVNEFRARVHPTDRARLAEAVTGARTTGGDLRVDHRVLWPDAQVRWISARGRAVLDETGAAVRLIGTAYDESAVRTAHDEAARLLEKMATGFLSVDRDWRCLYLNRAGARVVGYTAEELVGRVLWDAFPGLEDAEFGRQYKAVAASGQAAEFEAYYAHLNAWFEVRAEPDAGGIALYFLDISDRRADQERASAATARLELIASVSSELADAGLETEGAVARLSELVVPLLADWCLVSLIEGEHVRDVGSWHHDATMRPVLDTYVASRLVGRDDLGAVHAVRDTGQPVVIPSGVLSTVLPHLGPEAAAALTTLAPESYVVLPLSAHGSLTGVLSLIRGKDRAPMTAEEITTAREVASRAGLVLDNARLYAEQRGLAEGLQRSLLTTPPEPDHCEIAVRYVPAAEIASVGGDWFDSFLQSDGATVLVIGDVMGHDTAAAAAMSQVRSLLRGIAWHSGSAPAEVLSGLDAAMQGLQVTTTASAIVARLEQNPDELRSGVTRLRWSNAGHPPPMVIHPDGSVHSLTGGNTDLLLGIDPLSDRSDAVVVLDRGATVLLYTDGLVERRGQDLDEGLALLMANLSDLRDLPLSHLCDQLLARMVPETPADDVALVAVRLHRQDVDRPAEAGPESVPTEVPDHL